MTSTILQRACSSLAGLCLLAISWPETAEARHLTPSEAQQRVVETLRKQSAVPGARKAPDSRSASDLQLAYTSESVGADKAPAFYVFNYPASRSGDGDGFVIATADDRLRPVLGIATEGSFDATNIPSNVAWWLGEYEREIAAFLDSPTTSAVSSQVGSRAHSDNYATWDAIEPLISTKWDQGEPYNNLAPVLDPINPHKEGNCPTGCVATAVSQIVNYHRPVIPSGNGVYSYLTNSKRYPVSYDFDAADFDWDNMLNEYTYHFSPSSNDWEPDFTQAQGDAVANLMKACGVSVKMDYYYPFGAAAYSYKVPDALIKYFGFSENSAIQYRFNYDTSEWESIVYKELYMRRPVYYAGGSDDAGHAFVCDGYLYDGLFHINWGWGGDLDGYFALSALNPGQQISTTLEPGFDIKQELVLCIPVGSMNQPEKAKYVFEPHGDFMFLGEDSAGGGLFQVPSVNFRNFSGEDVKYKFAVCVEDENGNTNIYEGDVSYSASDSYYPTLRNQYGFDIRLEPGIYRVRPVARLKKTIIANEEPFEDIYIESNRYVDELTLIVDALGSRTYTPVIPERQAKIEVAKFKVLNTIYNKADDNRLSLTLVNTGNREYNEEIFYYIDEKRVGSFGIIIPEGESKQIEATFELPSSISDITGNHSLSLYKYEAVAYSDKFQYVPLCETTLNIEIVDGERPVVNFTPDGPVILEFDLPVSYYRVGDVFEITTEARAVDGSSNQIGIGIMLRRHGSEEVVWTNELDPQYTPCTNWFKIPVPSKIGLYDLVGYDISTGKEISRKVTISAGDLCEGIDSYPDIESNGIRLSAVEETQNDEVVIPDEIAGMPVVEIGDNLFKGNKNVTVIDIPSSVTEIGHDALRYTSNLQSLFLGSAQTFNLNYPQTVMYGTNPDLDIYVPEDKFNDFTGTKLSESYSVYKRITSLVAEETEVKMAVESEANISVPQTLLSDINPNFNVSVENPEVATVTLANGVINIKSKSAGRTNVIMKSAQPLVEPLSISVRVTKPGDPSYDLNEDGQVNVFDLTVLVDVIVSNTADVTLHDMNGDGEVNVFDLTELVNYIVGTPQSQNLSARSGHTLRELPLDLGCDGAYIAMQTDLRVSGEGKVRSVSLNPLVSDSHTVSFGEVVPGVVRIMVYSFGNTPIELPDGEELFTIGIDGSAEISCEDAMFVTVDRTIHHVVPTGVQRVESDSEVVGTDYYDMSGRRLSRQPDGICIRRVRYADGSFTTQKVTQ